MYCAGMMFCRRKRLSMFEIKQKQLRLALSTYPKHHELQNHTISTSLDTEPTPNSAVVLRSTGLQRSLSSYRTYINWCAVEYEFSTRYKSTDGSPTWEILRVQSLCFQKAAHKSSALLSGQQARTAQHPHHYTLHYQWWLYGIKDRQLAVYPSLSPCVCDGYERLN